MKQNKYLYVCAHVFSSAVYQTQVIDWLHLFKESGIEFELIHQFFFNPKRISFHKSQKKEIRKAFIGKSKFEYVFHTKSSTQLLNNLLFFITMVPYLIKNNKIIIFSRANIGREIQFMKRLFGNRIVFYYDLRSASVAEAELSMKVKKNFSQSNYRHIADLKYSEYLRQLLADKIFGVSNAIKEYTIETYLADPGKFVLYPCLSRKSKFFYDKEIRKITREQLGYSDLDNVYVYSGGVANSYHIPGGFLLLFERILRKDSNAKLLILTANVTNELYNLVESYAFVKNNVIIKERIPNHEVYKYLNAGDFGLLLRDDITVNNVASPSKFAEYMLCGLPTIISESVWDYAEYCRQNNSGIVLPNNTLKNLKEEDFQPLKKSDFNRNHIAEKAIELLSKESAAERIVREIRID